MRQAVVVAPQRSQVGDGERASHETVSQLCAALEAGGHQIARIDASPDLQAQFEAALSTLGSGDDLLVYIAAPTRVDGESVALRFDGEPGATLPLRALSDAVRARNPYAVAFVIETDHERDGRASAPESPGADVRPLAASLDARARGYALLVGWRPPSSVLDGSWPFTGRLVAALDDPRTRDYRGAVPISRVFERLVVDTAQGVEASVACERAWVDFVVLEPADVVQVAAELRASQPAPPLTPSVPPPSVAPPPPVASNAAPQSEDTSPAAELPSFPFPEDVAPTPAMAPGVPLRAEPDPFPTAPRAVTPPPPAAAPVAAGPSLTIPPPAPLPASEAEPSPAEGNAPAAEARAADALEVAKAVVALPSFPLPDEIDELLAAEPDPFPAAPSRPPVPPSPLPPPPAARTSVAPAPALAGAPAPAPAPTPTPSVSATLSTPLPPPRAPEPSLPALDGILDLADGARARGAWREAIAGYKAALALTPEGDSAGRALIHARMGEARVALGKIEEAERQFEQALEHDPKQRAALDGLVDLAIECKEPRRIIERRRQRARALERLDERVADLRAIAQVYGGDLGDIPASAATLEEARLVDPKNRVVVEELRAVYERMLRWPLIVQILGDLANALEAPDSAPAEGSDAARDLARERASLRFAAAEVAVTQVLDEPGACTLLDRALGDEPTNDKGLERLVALHASRADWDGLDAAYERAVARLARVGDFERAWKACRKLADLRLEQRDDAHGAIEALAGALRCKPDDAEARRRFADLLLASGDTSGAVREYEHLVVQAPTSPGPYARLFAIHQQAGRTDRAWLVGCALEELAAADMDQQLVVDQYRVSGPIRPARSLGDGAWDDLLRAPGSDDVVAQVLVAIRDAAADARVDELRDARKLVALDPERRQGASSTASAVRSFHWAAQVLGVEAPQLYALDEVPGGIAGVAAPAPSTVLGPEVLRGVGTKELAFLAGRHITYYRPEHYALVLYPTLSELSVLFLAAVKLAMPDLAVPDAMSAAVARMRKALARRLDDADKKRLDAAVERLHARDGRVDLAVWIRSVELTAHRAGLLLCGDLGLALGRVRGEIRTIAELGYDDKRADLLAFAVSERFAAARALLGVDARSSVAPAPDGVEADEGKPAA
jgi:tetratricopeptide (TPR) repeat protein